MIQFDTLPAYTLRSRSLPIDFFVDRLGSGRMVDDMDYQRGHVWSLERKQNLIRSVLMGVPFGAVTLNDRAVARFADPDDPRGDVFALIDGKQRVAALVGFMAGEFTTPAGWWSAADVDQHERLDVPHVGWGQLTARGRRRIADVALPVWVAQVSSVADERTIFDLVNFGGVPQGASDQP